MKPVNWVMSRARSQTVQPRLAAPSGLPAPLHADWVWRAPAWAAPLPATTLREGAEIAPGMKLFHDDPGAMVALLPFRSESASPPAALVLDIAAFSGSFLSLAVDLPSAALAGLRRRHIVQADTRVDAPGAEGVFLRLNLRHGPNTDRITQAIEPGTAQTAEFELFHTDFDEARVAAAWIDLIVARPVAGQIIIGDLIVARRPRAEV
jgi:hypothetical protein